VLKTTSQVISFHGKLEEAVVTQFTALADRYKDLSEKLQVMASENKRHKELIERTYREGVTDAFEVGFLNMPLDEDDYKIEPLSGELQETIEKAIRNEEVTIKFCRDAADRAGALIPNLPQTFRSLVKRKERRKLILKELLG
jgi:hypothetical protein